MVSWDAAVVAAQWILTIGTDDTWAMISRTKLWTRKIVVGKPDEYPDE